MPEPTSTAQRLHVPMLDLSREFEQIREPVMAAIEQVCSARHFVLGPPVEAFEAAAAVFCQATAAIGCASGTDALWLALAALGIGPGATVVTTPFSFFATVSAIARAGARPLLADIDPDTLNLSPESVSDLLKQEGAAKGCRALLPVHLYGQCADMDGLGAVAERYGLKMVEDAAQAFGACWRGRPAGALGDAAAFSFYPTKNLSAFGDAGMVTAMEEGVVERARALRNHGMRRRYFHDDFGEALLGANSRLDGIQGAVLSVKLKRLPEGNRQRRRLAGLYDALFQKAGLAAGSVTQGVVLPVTDARAEPIFHQYVIRAPRRDALRAFLAEEGIGSEVYYPQPLHLQESLRSLGYRKGDLPVAERAAEEVLALPIFPELRDEEVEAVVDGVRRFYA